MIKISIYVSLVVLFFVYSSLLAQGRISVIGIMEPNAPTTLTRVQADRLKQTIRTEIERMSGFYILEDKLMRSILEQQELEGSCETDVCYFGIGSLMGTEFLIGTNLTRASGNNFAGEIVLFNISNREVVNRISFTHSGDFNSFIQNQSLLSAIREVFRARIRTITSNVRRYRVGLGENIVLDYSFSPSNAVDDVMIRINNPDILRRVDRKTLATVGQGSTFIELYSLSDNSVSTRIEVEIGPAKKDASQDDDGISISFKPYLTPFAVVYAMYHGPAGGLGVGAGFRLKDDSPHYFGFEVEKALLPKDIWWFKENRVLGWAFVYIYDMANQRTGWALSPGISLGNREFYSKHYFANREDFNEMTINYYVSPLLKVQRGGFANTISLMLDFDNLVNNVAIKFTSGYRFSF